MLIDSSNSDRPQWFGFTIEPCGDEHPPRLTGWVVRRGPFEHRINRPPESLSASEFDAFVTASIDVAVSALRAKEDAAK